jgi:hypothetical protein
MTDQELLAYKREHHGDPYMTLLRAQGMQRVALQLRHVEAAWTKADRAAQAEGAVSSASEVVSVRLRWCRSIVCSRLPWWQSREMGSAGNGFWMCDTQAGFKNRHRAFEQHVCPIVVTLADGQRGQVVQAHRHIGVAGSRSTAGTGMSSRWSSPG